MCHFGLAVKLRVYTIQGVIVESGVCGQGQLRSTVLSQAWPIRDNDSHSVVAIDLDGTVMSSLLTLPSELIEAVLVCSCSPRTVASVAQTCWTLHRLVYASPDSHLWRELFLTTWDDPRPALQHRALVDPRIDLVTWDWGTNYRRRVSADRWLKAWRRDICLADHEAEQEDADTEWCTTTLSTLSAVLDTLLTLRPFPATPPIALTVLTPATAISPYPTGNTGSGVGGRRERMTSAPPLPPLLIVLASGISAFEGSQSCVRVGRMVYGLHTSRALGNGLGREKADQTPIPTPSLPPQLVRTLLASRAVGVRGLPAYVPTLSLTHHLSDALGDVFNRIICITGFVPIPPPLVSTSTTSTTASAELERRYDGDDELGTQEDGEQHLEEDLLESDGHPVPRITKAFPTPLEQHADARILARRRVYDMRYLRGDRLWGPFQIVTRESVAPCPGTGRQDGNRRGKPREGRQRASTSGRRGGVPRRGTLTWAVGVDIRLDGFDSTPDDSEDEDWRDPADPEREQTTGGEDTVDIDVDMETELTEPEHPFFSFVLGSTGTADTANNVPVTDSTSTASHRRILRSHSRLPPNHLVSPREIGPQHLRPDYAYLASVRIVVEANLKELFGSEVSDDVGGTASEVRPGEVGMFWEDEDEILRAQAVPPEPGAFSVFSSWPSGVMPDLLL